MKIIDMPAGREMDLLIAEYFCGYRRTVDDTYDYEHVQHMNEILLPPGQTLDSLRNFLPPSGKISFGFFVTQKYSERIEDAWPLFQILQRKFFSTEIIARDHSDVYYIQAEPRHGHGEVYDTLIISGNGICETICRAALLSVGVKEVEDGRNKD